MLTLDELIQELADIRQREGSIEVCRIGHFGEANEMHAMDFYVAETTGLRVKKVLHVEPPDIGPEPD